MSSPSQLFSCINADQILKSPINDSTAKHHWSFSKDSRFKKPKYYCDSFYQIPGIKDNKNRKAGFGYGKKTDLDIGKHPHNQTPSPDKYIIDSFVEINMNHEIGFTPLFSRQDIAPMSYIDVEQKKNPGPGRYDEYRYNQSPKWSMRPRVSSQLFPKTTNIIVPAPCTYNNPQQIGKNKTGKYHTTKYPNSKSKVFNPPRSKRFNKSSTDVPPPCAYEPQNNLSPQGKYVLSKNVSAGKRTFMNGRRTSFTDIAAKRSFTPGPGNYRTSSDFGYYDSKKQRYMRLSKSQMSTRQKKMQISAQTNFTNNKSKNE